jgi:glycine hydroxymethyltransferase
VPYTPCASGQIHNHARPQTIAGIATALHQAAQPTWKAYAQQVVKNARTLAAELVAYGYKLQTGGTDNHLVLWDLRPLGLTGSKVEKIGDLVGITINKNAVSGDASAQVPGGIRIGTAALTSRDMVEDDLKAVAGFLHRSVQLALLLQKEAGSKMLKDFVRVATKPEEGKVGHAQVSDLKTDVHTFARRFPLPGVVGEIVRPQGIAEDD